MNLLRHRSGRLLTFGSLYFSEGAPIGLIWWALPAYLRTKGLPLEQITSLTASLVLFWALKFIWAPMIDAWRTARFGYRGWIFSAQLAMGLTLLPLLYTDPAQDFVWFSTLLIAHSFCATLQDVAIDAFAIGQTSPRDRGALNGSMQAGMLIGRSAFGGGALLASALWGWSVVFGALIVSIWASMIVLLFARDDVTIETPQRREALLTALARAFSLRQTRLGLLFALTSAAAFEAVGALAGPFLIDRGVSQETLGWFYGIPVVASTLTGGILGGLISDRLSRARSVGIFLIGFVAFILMLAYSDSSGPNSASNALRMSLLAGMYFFVGLFTAASYALFMDLTDPRVGGTQFSSYMSATNACESWSAWTGGRLATRHGYPAAFLVVSIVSLLSLSLLGRLNRNHGKTGPDSETSGN